VLKTKVAYFAFDITFIRKKLADKGRPLQRYFQYEKLLVFLWYLFH